MLYDCVIIGGGIAGLQAAILLGRYSVHRVLVVDAGRGRSSLCRSYRNILGWPEGISGEELRKRGKAQAEAVGVAFAEDHIIKAEQQPDHTFVLTGQRGSTYSAKTLLLATGIMDRFPDIPGLLTTFGRTVYVCPDCDGYEIQDRHTVMIGSGNAGANMSLLLAQRARSLTFINHEQQPVEEAKLRQMQKANIRYIEQPVTEIMEENDGEIRAVRLADGTQVEAERGFIAFGGNHVHSGLAEQLGVTLHHNKHVETNPRSKMTNIKNVWAAGDLAVHAEQATTAMGDGAIAAIWIHKELMGLLKD